MCSTNEGVQYYWGTSSVYRICSISDVHYFWCSSIKLHFLAHTEHVLRYYWRYAWWCTSSLEPLTLHIVYAGCPLFFDFCTPVSCWALQVMFILMGCFYITCASFLVQGTRGGVCVPNIWSRTGGNFRVRCSMVLEIVQYTGFFPGIFFRGSKICCYANVCCYSDSL